MLDTSSAKAERISIGDANATGAAAIALQKLRLCNIKLFLILPPARHYACMPQRWTVLVSIKRNTHVLDRKTDQDDGQKARKHFGNVELVLALEDVPAEPALP